MKKENLKVSSKNLYVASMIWDDMVEIEPGFNMNLLVK